MIDWSKDFQDSNAKEWIEEIKKSIKDSSELEQLLWKTYEGFSINSFYTHESDIKHFPLTKKNKGWEIRQLIYTDKIQAANQSILKALENGADSILYKGSLPDTESEITALFKDIKLDWIANHFDFGESNLAWLYLWIDLCNSKKLDLNKLHGSINYDPLGDLMISGNFDYNQEETEKVFGAYIQTSKLDLPLFKSIGINARNIRESGGNATQELAVAIAIFVEYVEWIKKNSLNPEDYLSLFQFNLSVEGNYFIEIAKFKAFRVIYQMVMEAYGWKNIPIINATTTNRNKTVYDEYNNILRSTSESMSAIIGGVDSVTILPFNENHKLPDEFSYRMSRNIQILLKEEVFLDKVEDVAAGSYYIDYIIQELINHSWGLFIEIENQNGYISALKNKYIQQKVEQINVTQQTNYNSVKDVLIGSNKYINKSETKSGQFTKLFHQDISKEEKLIIPLKLSRLSEKIEIQRLKSEETNYKK